MSDKSWVQSLSSGDNVIVSYNRTDVIYAVERVTKTQIVLKGCHTKYRRRDGHSIGANMWSWSFLVEATPERVEKVKRDERYRKLSRFLYDVKWDERKLETLEAVYKTLMGMRNG